jgi:hypothetical protein
MYLASSTNLRILQIPSPYCDQRQLLFPFPLPHYKMLPYSADSDKRFLVPPVLGQTANSDTPVT